MIADILPEIVYPSRDGKRMADNTLQFRWMVTIEGGLESVFRDNPNVFVAGDLLWYPVEGNSRISIAPDIMLVFGRPKGDRKSYKQWEEDNVAPQAAFEILSDSNDFREMAAKQDFYEEYGVDEYYVYDPNENVLRGWIRDGESFRKIQRMNGWVSPLMKIRFELDAGELAILGPDGKRFLPYSDLVKDRNDQAQRAADAEKRYADLLARLSDQGIAIDAPPTP